MAVLTKDKRLTIANDPDFVWIPSEFQILKSVALFDIENAYSQADAYAEIGLMAGGHDVTNRVTVFDAGYVGTFSSLHWTGSFPTENECFIYAMISGPDNHYYRLAVTLWKIVTTEGGRFVVDP